MRGKFIAIFSLIVVLVGVLAFALLRFTLGDVLADPKQARDDAARSAAAAETRLELEALKFERWLDAQSGDKQTREPFLRDTDASRSEQATLQANRLFDMATRDFRATPPSLIAFVDDKGVSLGRNGGNLLRGENLGAVYPPLLDAMKKGASGSDVWVTKARNEQMLVSYAPVVDDNNHTLGGVLIGTPLDDGRLSHISEVTSGRPLAFVFPGVGGLVAKTVNLPGDALDALTSGPLQAPANANVGATQPQQLVGGPSNYAVAEIGLGGYGDRRRAAIVAFSAVNLVESVNGELLPPVAVATLIGLALVVAAGILLANYIGRPIVELEQGILSIINGQTERRFEIEHAELGGLVFSINSLLNHLMGVQEDTTDDEGRPSIKSPSPGSFDADLGASTAAATGGEQSAVTALRAEPADAYYHRLFAEYIEAKKAAGDPTEHITEDAFVQRIQASEADTGQRHGKPVRYRVELRGREVMLIAVPLE